MNEDERKKWLDDMNKLFKENGLKWRDGKLEAASYVVRLNQNLIPKIEGAVKKLNVEIHADFHDVHVPTVSYCMGGFNWVPIATNEGIRMKRLANSWEITIGRLANKELVKTYFFTISGGLSERIWVSGDGVSGIEINIEDVTEELISECIRKAYQSYRSALAQAGTFMVDREGRDIK